MRYKFSFAVFLIITFITQSCGNKTEVDSSGSLFIIGGGSRPQYLVEEMVSRSNITDEDYAVILPYSSEVPVEACEYITEQLSDAGITNIHQVYFDNDTILSKKQKELIGNAKLIYITGGDQNRFMKVSKKNGLKSLLQKAHSEGAMIAGTSAGAAVMSEKMITGNSHKYPEYTGDFPTIEADNIEIKEGLGFVKQSIIDQHFIVRQRLNRLISVAMENPQYQCIGIDESTALFVNNNQATVLGQSQVICLTNSMVSTVNAKGQLGGTLDQITVYLPGDSFSIK